MHASDDSDIRYPLGLITLEWDEDTSTSSSKSSDSASGFSCIDSNICLLIFVEFLT